MMRGTRRSTRPVVAALAITGLLLTACGSSDGDEAASEPFTLEPIAGTEFNRVTLTQRAAERLGIATAAVRNEDITSTPADGTAAVTGPRLVVPYAAVLYDSGGGTFAYTSPQPLVFVRQPIEVEYIEGDLAVLKAGPPVGTAVVTVGAAELLGTEFEVGD
jgi:hypothetical protein